MFRRNAPVLGTYRLSLCEAAAEAVIQGGYKVNRQRQCTVGVHGLRVLCSVRLVGRELCDFTLPTHNKHRNQ